MISANLYLALCFTFVFGFRVESIEENAQKYYGEGKIQATSDVTTYLEVT